jgi:hypothetical protein
MIQDSGQKRKDISVGLDGPADRMATAGSRLWFIRTEERGLPAGYQRQFLEILRQAGLVGACYHGAGFDSLQHSRVAVVVGWKETPM